MLFFSLSFYINTDWWSVAYCLVSFLFFVFFYCCDFKFSYKTLQISSVQPRSAAWTWRETKLRIVTASESNRGQFHDKEWRWFTMTPTISWGMSRPNRWGQKRGEGAGDRASGWKTASIWLRKLRIYQTRLWKARWYCEFCFVLVLFEWNVYDVEALPKLRVIIRQYGLKLDG